MFPLRTSGCDSSSSSGSLFSLLTAVLRRASFAAGYRKNCNLFFSAQPRSHDCRLRLKVPSIQVTVWLTETSLGRGGFVVSDACRTLRPCSHCMFLNSSLLLALITHVSTVLVRLSTWLILVSLLFFLPASLPVEPETSGEEGTIPPISLNPDVRTLTVVLRGWHHLFLKQSFIFPHTPLSRWRPCYYYFFLTFSCVFIPSIYTH